MSKSVVLFFTQYPQHKFENSFLLLYTQVTFEDNTSGCQGAR